MSVLDNQSAPQRSKRLFPERPYMTLDFLADEMLIKGNIGPLGKIPVISQESAIIEDLLYCFIGKKYTNFVLVIFVIWNQFLKKMMMQ